ncbi:MAG: VCBS repeat-containing protein [Pyrinomonadaceae bacterium]|nr:VCBS repeat-containing protein [Pyrinomonadaceae bacterium]
MAVALAADWRAMPAKAAPSANSDSPATTTITIPIGPDYIYIAAGNLNGDGFPDIVTAKTGSYITIFNNGAGGFLAPTRTDIGSSTHYDLRDFNNDGRPDLFYAILPFAFDPWVIHVRLSNVLGEFAPPVITQTGISSTNFVDVAYADFNNDNKVDLSITTSGPGVSLPAGSARVLLGDGSGGFTFSSSNSLRPRGFQVATADFNQDGKQDIAATSLGGSCIPGDCGPALQVLFGDGTGNFPTRNTLTQPGYLIQDFVTGDVNNDGKTDLIGLTFTTALNTVTTLLGTGAGDFVAGGTLTLPGSSLAGTKVADFNNDGKLDVAVVSTNNNVAYIVFGDGIGGFTNIYTLGVGISPRNLTVADFNANGNLDLAVVNASSNSVTALLDPNGSTPALKNLFDFTGDIRADIAVYREGDSPTLGSFWHIRDSNNTNYQSIQFGSGGDKPVPADYNGDNKIEVAVWRPSNGTWYTSTNPAINYAAVQWGANGDIPIPGDFDGDGKADHAVYRPSNGVWYVLRSSDGGFQFQQFGTSTDKPLLGDFDGDGKTDYAFYRPGATATATSFWHVRQSSNGAVIITQFGLGEDKAVPADYDGDVKTDIAVFRPSASTWFTSTNPAINYGAFVWGAAGDVPAPADYDRDGKADLAVFRPGNASWYIRRSTDATLLSEQWGLAGDKPVPASFIP